MNTQKVSRASRQSFTIRRMVVTAMLSAITALLAFTPVGMITLPPPLPAVTLVHIPVILAALLEGPWVGVPVGLVFGLCSLIRAWGTGMVGLTLFFRNPLVSVLPRMIIPLTAWGVYALWTRTVRQNRATNTLGAVIASVIGSLTNTVLCLGMIVILYGAELSTLVNNLIALGGANNAYLDNAGAWLVVAVGLPNGLAEAVVAAVVVPMIKAAVAALAHRGGRRGPRVTEPVLDAGGDAAACATPDLNAAESMTNRQSQAAVNDAPQSAPAETPAEEPEKR